MNPLLQSCISQVCDSVQLKTPWMQSNVTPQVTDAGRFTRTHLIPRHCVQAAVSKSARLCASVRRPSAVSEWKPVWKSTEIKINQINNNIKKKREGDKKKTLPRVLKEP